MMPTFTMRQLLEAGVHFGHQTRRWDPKMAPYLFGSRGGIHIIDLQQTVPMLHHSLEVIRDTVANGGRVLFVGTKRQASQKIKEAASLCGQFYVNHRWLGGMLTNWKTISQSITRLRFRSAELRIWAVFPIFSLSSIQIRKKLPLKKPISLEFPLWQLWIVTQTLIILTTSSQATMMRSVPLNFFVPSCLRLF